MCDPVSGAFLASGAAQGLSSIIGGGVSASAANRAAQTQANATLQAAQLQNQAQMAAIAAQQGQFNTIQGQLAPYYQGGLSQFGQLLNTLPDLTSNQLYNYPFSPYDVVSGQQTPLQAAQTVPLPTNLALLAQTPGYQFTLQQGLEATQSGYAAQGLGSSGAAIKGAGQYAAGLAAQTYQQQFQNALNTNQLYSTAQQAGITNLLNAANSTLGFQNQNEQLALQQQLQRYNMLAGTANVGAQAATNQGQFGTQLATNIGQIQTGTAQAVANQITAGAAAQAAGTVGSANAITNALGGAAGAGSNTALLLALNQAGMFGGQFPANQFTVPGTDVGMTPAGFADNVGALLSPAG